jgi:hypothetical protein
MKTKKIRPERADFFVLCNKPSDNNATTVSNRVSAAIPSVSGGAWTPGD